MNILRIIFVVVFLSDLLRNILKCNCSPSSIYYAAMFYNHSSMRKVHLVNDLVVYVYLIDTVYVKKNLPTEFSKMTIFII